MRLTGFVAAIVLGALNAASSQTIIPDTSDRRTLYEFCQDFQTLYVDIREQSVEPDSARLRFSSIMNGLKARFQTYGDSARQDSAMVMQAAIANMVFPLRNYTTKAIGGTHGEGYRDKGFDLFDYKVRGSHPAHDIFVADRNQDNLDDKTGAGVDVLAMTSGLVIGIETGWKPGSEYRGGNWIWVYDPVLHGLFYYAHNNVVAVTPGQWVQAGQKISEVGRSGFNAYNPRSPTHLHLMYLEIQPNGLPVPRNTYNWLLTAKVMN